MLGFLPQCGGEEGDEPSSDVLPTS